MSWQRRYVVSPWMISTLPRADHSQALSLFDLPPPHSSTQIMQLQQELQARTAEAARAVAAQVGYKPPS